MQQGQTEGLSQMLSSRAARLTGVLSCACAVLLACLIAAGSLLRKPPGGALTMSFAGADILAHTAAYGALCALLIGARIAGQWKARLAWAAVAAGLYGLILECVQPLVGRGFELQDLAADAVGILTVLLGAALLRKMRTARPRLG